MKTIVENKRPVKEAKHASFIKYRKEKTTRVEIVFTGEMKKFIDGVSNRARFIKSLIEKEMKNSA